VSALVSGVSTYVLLIAAAAGLGAGAFDVFSLYWAVLVTVTVGGYLPVEQIIARHAASRSRAVGLVRWAAGWGIASSAAGAGALALVVLVLDREEVPGGFVAVLGVNLVGMAAQSTVRGLAAGTGRLDVYAAIVTADALLRTVAVAVAASCDIRSVGVYAGAIAGACLLSVIAGGVGLRRQIGARDSSAAAPDHRLLTAEALSLVPAMLSMQVIVNSAVIIAFLVPQGAGAGAVLALSSLARTSVFVVQGAQAAYVGRIAALVFARSDRARPVTRGVLLAVVLLAALTVGGTFLLGPELVTLLYGPDFVVSRVEALAVGAGIALFVVAIAANDLRVAWGRHQLSGAVWFASAAVALLAAMLPWDSPSTTIFLPTIVASTMALLLLIPWRQPRGRHRL
jgi:O-antigen/teichoic acid export membrane protein